MAKRKATTAASPSSLALRASRFPHRRYQCPAALARLYAKASTVQLDPLLHADQAQTGERRSVGRHGQVIEPDAVVLDRQANAGFNTPHGQPDFGCCSVLRLVVHRFLTDSDHVRFEPVPNFLLLDSPVEDDDNVPRALLHPTR